MDDTTWFSPALGSPLSASAASEPIPTTASTETQPRGRAASTETPLRGRSASTETPPRGRATSTETPQRGRAASTETPQRGRATSTETPQRGRSTSRETQPRGRATSTETQQRGRRAGRSEQRREVASLSNTGTPTKARKSLHSRNPWWRLNRAEELQSREKSGETEEEDKQEDTIYIENNVVQGSDPSFSDAVRVLRGDSSSVSVEKCAQLTRFPVVPRHRSSLLERFMKMSFQMKSHVDMLIFRTRVVPLTLFIYVVPRDASMITAVEDEAKRIGGKRIDKHRPDAAIWMNAKFSLKSKKAEISPNEITLKYARPPDLFEVFVENAEESIDLQLISDGDTIWQATLRQVDYSEPSDVAGSSLRVSAAYLLIPTTASTETPPRGRATGRSEQRSEEASLSNTELVSKVQRDLITRGSEGLLRGMLDSLQAERPSVVRQWEVNNVLQGSRVLQDQWRCLLTMLQNKGEIACGIMLRVFKDLDYYLYEDLGL